MANQTKTQYAPSLPPIPQRCYSYKANRNKVFDPIPLPFVRLPRCFKEVGEIPVCQWYVPQVDDYGLACRIGQEYAAHFVQYIKDNPESVPNNHLGGIIRAIDFEDESTSKGYWVGFITELSRFLLVGMKRIDVFEELDRGLAEEEKVIAGNDSEADNQ